MQFSQFLGYLATFLFSIIMIPQVVKTIKRKSVKDISLSMLTLSLIANGIALWYAVLINQVPLIVKYVLAIVVMSAYLLLYFKIRKAENATDNK